MNSVGNPEVYREQAHVVRGYSATTGTSIEEAINMMYPAIREGILAYFAAEQKVITFAKPGAVVVPGGPLPWIKDYDPSSGYLWSTLNRYLSTRKHWHSDTVDDLDLWSTKILSYIEDPKDGAPYAKDDFRVAGLVLGYVQSGKTANFTALIAKAVDRGYKLVIVLSGIHNSLRAQTQRRLDLELGLVDDPRGVGKAPREYAMWNITQSTTTGDFKPGTDAAPLRTGMPGLMVVKKNATVLNRVNEWLDDDLTDLPVLIIDDESDQASIDTKYDSAYYSDLSSADQGDFAPDKELDPSTINGLIRELVGKFKRVSYVAYTATPFANIFIDPNASTTTHGQDLYPSNFIISLPRPGAYIGAEKIFGRPSIDEQDDPLPGLDVIRHIPFGEVPLLTPKRKDEADWTPIVTPTLRLALLDWILASAAKSERLGGGMSSMLIHTSHKTDLQNRLFAELTTHIKRIRQEWLYDGKNLRETLRQRWDADFVPVVSAYDLNNVRTFEQIEPAIDQFFEHSNSFELIALNSTSKDTLDYEKDPNLTVLLLGGNRLSRGLTIEDLTVSYFCRNANNYDTLLQMGRWFGYRAKYADLTRLWTTRDLVAKFRHLSLVEEELRDEIKMYERDRLTPRQIAPKVRTHPAMLATARNRMGSAEPVQQTYSGRQLQTVRFMLHNTAWLENNLTTAKTLLKSLGEPHLLRGSAQQPIWQNVPWESVVGFLQNFNSAQEASSFDSATIAAYVQQMAAEHSELTHWTVSVVHSQYDPEKYQVDFGSDFLRPVTAMTRSRLKSDDLSVGVLMSPAVAGNFRASDESVGLSNEQVAAAEATFIRDQALATEGQSGITMGYALREQRDNTEGLLLIYPISPLSRGTSQNRQDLFDEPNGKPPVIGVGISLPTTRNLTSVPYVRGRLAHKLPGEEGDESDD
ncbi:Z1 domain-containing protein [Pseudarthrobacter sp. HLT3-5]|uniref:Z1 domain-containing protein n=1 Tax=Pseudarthrobacter cellobiosi TaxID=2953654 RepID=UPI00208FF74A|nr:Z1 domain-containing protein [Pseudarthrobacter sp. HLT3-5]MCO4273837.1 Z1 domain-containing protein [Pseudarthrobacter sp. HLT3-5]